MALWGGGGGGGGGGMLVKEREKYSRSASEDLHDKLVRLSTC